MPDRLVLKAMCDRSKHVVASVIPEKSGYVVRLNEAVYTGYGNRFKIEPTTYRLNGPIGDPEVWTTFGGCRCGHQFAVDSLTLQRAIRSHQRVLVLSPWVRES